MSSTNSRRAARSSGRFVLGAGLVLVLGIWTRRSKAIRRGPAGPAKPAAVVSPPAQPAINAAEPANLAATEASAGTDRAVPNPAIRAAKLITSAVLYALILVAFAAFLFVGVGPLSGRYRVITVLSGSMRPTMPPGSLVVSAPEPVTSLRVGQVITFQAPTEQHQVVTHRVIQIIRQGDVTKIRTKGDANASPDVWLAKVEGTTVWRERTAIRNGGRVVYWFRQPAVHRITVDVIPAALIVLVLWIIWGSDAPHDAVPYDSSGELPVPA